MGSKMQICRGLNEKRCKDVNWIFLLSGSNQRLSELVGTWIVRIWRDEKREGKVREKEEREYNTELSLAFVVLVKN